MTARQITATVSREPVRTEIEHRADGTLVIRQHSQDVVRDETGQEIGRTNGFTTVQLDPPELGDEIVAQLGAITSLGEAKLASISAATAQKMSDVEVAPLSIDALQ